MTIRTMAEALNAALGQAMAADDRIVLIGEDIAGGCGIGGHPGALGGAFGVTCGLYERFGAERVIDTPISEAGLLSIALGAALTGLKPVAEIMFNDFSAAGFDVLLNQAAKLPWLADADCPLVVRMAYGAGDSSGPHHSQSLYHLFAGISGLDVVVPSTPADAAGMLNAAIASDRPTLIFEHKLLYRLSGEVPDPGASLPPGTAALRRQGTDLSICATGLMAVRAEAAGAALGARGVDADILDMRSIAPLDEAAVLDSVGRTGRVLVVDEGPPVFGLADRIAGLVARQRFAEPVGPVAVLTPPASPSPYSPPLEAAWLPDSAAIESRAMELIKSTE